MPNIIGILFAVILAVLALFYVPTYQNLKAEENLMYMNTYSVVTDFVDNVRMKGYVTPQMYEDYQNRLSLGSVIYDFEMTHEHKIYTPVYTDRADVSTFNGEYIVQYDEFYRNNIEAVLYDQSIPIEKRMYKLEHGDFFDILIENKTKLKSTMLFDFLTLGFGTDAKPITIPYGGMVLNEDWSN